MLPRCCKMAVVLMAILPFSLTSQVKQERQDKPAAPIRVNVELVSMNVVVSDPSGRYISGLTKDNFKVLEDNIEQQITHFSPIDQPFNVVLTLDTSGSMKERLWKIQEESIRFTELLHPDDEVAVVSFDDEVRLESDFSMDRKRIMRGIKSTRTGESTQVYEGVYLSLDQVLGPRQGRKAMVLFTDGVDTSSRDTSQKETLKLAEESEAIIYPIKFNTRYDMMRGGQGRRQPGLLGGGIGLPRIGVGTGGGMPGPDADREYMIAGAYLAKLAEVSGGRVVDADTIDDLGAAFEQVADDLRHQYSIGYMSTNPKHDGKFRKVKITVDKPGTVIRSRRGYYSPKS
jgi:Ca-activated chloride channel family protein